METFESRRFWRSIAVGVALTLFTCVVDQSGLLSPLDGWCYDKRAAICQLFSKPPDQRIEHVDIDNAALDPGALGRWPWSRRVVARIIDEIGLAKPAALGLDLYLSEPENQTSLEPTTAPVDDSATPDAALAAALGRQKMVVLTEDMPVQSAAVVDPQLLTATREMASNLEMSSDDLLAHLRLHGEKVGGAYELQDLQIRARRSAITTRVTQQLTKAPLTDDQLITRLLPNSDPNIQTPAVLELKEEAAAYRTRQAFQRFGFTAPPLAIPPIPAVFEHLPLKRFSDKSTYCGFVNYEFFNSPTVRSIPLVVETDSRLYPQFGFAFGCAILGADPRKAVVKVDHIEIPVPNSQPLRIPTHLFHSTTLDQNFSSIADIPWFGTHDWLTMYDWPNHKRQTNHLSVNVLWDICKATDKIRNNNHEIDKAIDDLLGVNQIDQDFNAKYQASLPVIEDSQTRAKVVAQALASSAHLIEAFAQIPDRSQDENEQFENLKRDKSALQKLVQNNGELRKQVDTQRSNVADKIGGKGVLFGWTADGYVDHVSTSLHSSCPGVVAHGVIAEAVLSGVWWRVTPNWICIAIVLFLGAVTAFLVADLQPFRASLATLLLAAGFLLLNGFILFDYGWWTVPVAGPIVTMSVVWGGCTLQRVIYEGIERNRVATEVAIINKEMDLARQVQAALIPKSAPIIPGLDANGWTQAASVAGGDCYDLWTLPDGRLGILLADASGHGLAPAMVVSQVRTLVRALCEFESHPHGLLQRVNARVAEDLEAGRFITVFLGFLSPDGLLEYASAGHGPQFWYGCNGEEMELLDSTGAPLGFDTEWFADDPLPPIQIGTGCSLVIFSDGIFEAMDPTGDQYGIDRLKSLLHNARDKSGKVIINEVIAAMDSWQHKRPPADDQTVVIAQRTSLPQS